MTVLTLIQARMSSSRLPGKVLEPIAGLPSIVFMVRRLARSRRIDSVVVATSVDASDDLLVETLIAQGIDYYRGSLDDVLSRFAGAARGRGAETIVRLTGDCPMIDADLVDRVIELVADQGYDYASNSEVPTFPNGLDAEAFTLAALERAHAEAVLGSDREHVTPFMKKPETGLRRGLVRSTIELSDLRWTVDHPDDLAFVQGIAEALGPNALTADRFDVLRVIDGDPERHVQGQHTRNEGFAKSLEMDRQMQAGRRAAAPGDSGA